MPVMPANIVVFDTSVLIDHLRTGRYQQRMDLLTGLVRTSAVVLSELWRGATKTQERRFLESLARDHPILTPTERIWLDSGQILGKIGARRGFSPDKLRDLHFDILIALTARSCGARLITANRSDFELISSYKKVELEIW